MAYGVKLEKFSQTFVLLKFQLLHNNETLIITIEIFINNLKW